MNLKATLKLIILVICSGSLVLLFSCKTKQAIITQYVKVDSIVYKETTVTEYDTIITPADSATIKAYFECDSLGNVLIRELNEEKGKLKVRTIFKDNMIEVQVNVDSAEIIRQAEKQFISKYNTDKLEIKEQLTKRQSFNWWEYFIVGLVCGGAIIIFLRKIPLLSKIL